MKALVTICYLAPVVVFWGFHFGLIWAGVPNWLSTLTFAGAIALSAIVIFVLTIIGGSGR